MVEVSTRMAQPVTSITASRPSQARKDRLAKIAAARDLGTVRVTAANEDVRRLIKHPRAGGFQTDGSAEWPNDSFTARRIADGDVKVDD